MYRYSRTTLSSAIVIAGLATTTAAGPAIASTAPLSQMREVAHFDITALQQPENITLEPDGAADVTFTRARQIARVTPEKSILATLPAPASGSATVSGIVRAADGTLYVNYTDGTLYVNYNAGSLSGIWRIRPGGTPGQVAALPEVKVREPQLPAFGPQRPRHHRRHRHDPHGPGPSR